MIAPRDARNVAHFGVWSFVWTVLWNTAIRTTAPDAQGNEGDVQVVGVEIV